MIGAKNEPGKGSAFHSAAEMGLGSPAKEVCLPLSGGTARSLPSPEQGTAGDKWKVLLAEDDEGNQMVARALLEGLGVKVTVAENGREAVAAARDSRFDLVLMDVQMPEMDGYQAAAQIRLQGRLASLPIVALTAGTSTGERRRCLAAGMDDYLAKPIEPAELEKTLAKWLGSRHEGDPGRAPSGGTKHLPPSGGTETPEAEAKSALPETLPGIDLKPALARLGGDAALYLRLLERFGVECGDVARRIAEALGNKDTKTARYLAHKLTGTATTIGAADVAAGAGAVERAIEQGGCEAADLLLDDLSEALAVVFRSLSSLDEDGFTEDTLRIGETRSC